MTSTAETPGSDAFHASLAGLVHSVEGSERRVAAAQIEQLRLLAAAGRLAESQAAGSPGRVREHDMILRSIAAELGGVMRVADRTVQRRISEARVIVEDFPGALA
ncbi:MAG TPA: HNH endonuclease, partial [Microbacterium sp.]|nr:HNH endonuclease [Microbacterium sp.]